MLKTLTVQNFRCYARGKWNLDPGLTLIVGPNAIGKTNIVEAIYLLATGKSFRSELNKELVQEEKGFFRVLGDLTDGQLEVIQQVDGGVGGKIFRVNGVNRRLVDFVGKLPAVVFAPQDIEIVADSPSTRRRYMDQVLALVYRDYRLASHLYDRALRQRNRLLWRIREEGLDRGQLDYWNDLLITNGRIIHERRREFLEYQNARRDKFLPLNLHYDHSIISAERLARYAKEEVAAAMTLVGPHRDDFAVQLLKGKTDSGHNIKFFGSRGEQRMAVFTLKLGELEFVGTVLGVQPLLLLDDIFSELDPKNRHRLLEVIPHQQTIMTTTDLHLVEKAHLGDFKIIELG